MWDFLRQHWGPILFALVTVAALLFVVARTLLGVARACVLAVRRPRALGQSGSAMAEFVIVCIPFMLMLTALMQLALASLARVLVSYAAFTAARAAIVVIPVGAGDQTPLAVNVGGEGANKLGFGSNQRLDLAVSTKAAYIRNAAAYVMIPASPAIDTVVEDTVNNWSSYWKNRAQAGVNGLDVVLDLVGQLTRLPPAEKAVFDKKVSDIFAGGLETPEEKAAARAGVDALLLTLPQGERDAVRKQLDGYIDSYQGSQSPPPGGNADWALAGINDTTTGTLGQYRDGLLNAYWSARNGQTGGQGGTYQKGYAVDRALDSGFGSGTDGAGGAILRALRKFIYARVGTIVTLHGANGQLKTQFAPGEPVTAKVTHLFYCQIPLANRFAGKAFYDLPLQTQLDATTGPLKYATAIGIPGYFLALQAQHTLINQGKP
jgi:Flp pilus assembly protein TadG